MTPDPDSIEVTEKTAVTEDVASLILEALSTVQLNLSDPEYITRVDDIKAVRACLDVDNPNRKAPYSFTESAKQIAIQSLSNLSIPVTHPNWVQLTEILIKARVELGIVQ